MGSILIFSELSCRISNEKFMNNKIVSVFFLSLLLVLTSCVEDSSTGIINEVNEVRIEGVEKEYRVMLYDELLIEPDVTTLKKDSKLSYLWYLNTPTSSLKADTLSFDKNLKLVFTPAIATPGEKYELTYKVTDQETGLFVTKVAKFDLMTQFTKGTLILCETDSESELHFLNKTNVQNHKLLENCYMTANDGSKPGNNPTGIFALNPNNFKPQMREVLLSCGDDRGGAFLNPNTLRDHRTLGDAIQFRPNESFSISAYFKASMIDYLIVNGQVCKRAVNMGNMTWEAPMVSVDGEKSYHAVVPQIDILGITHFYDQKFGRLLAHAQWNMGALKKVGGNDNDNTFFDINNIGPDMTYLCGGNAQLAGNYWMALRNKTDNSVWIYKFMVESKNNLSRFVSKSKIQLTSVVAANISEASCFRCLIKVPGVLFFSTSNGIYSVDLNTISQESNSEVKLIDASEKQFEFTGFEMDTYSVDKMVNGVVETEDELLIKAYIKDLSLNGRRGGFAEYSISQTGGLQASYVNHISGFCDSIVDLEEKYN